VQQFGLEYGKMATIIMVPLEFVPLILQQGLNAEVTDLQVIHVEMQYQFVISMAIAVILHQFMLLLIHGQS
jgi:hypothetical protein